MNTDNFMGPPSLSPFVYFFHSLFLILYIYKNSTHVNKKELTAFRVALCGFNVANFIK